MGTATRTTENCEERLENFHRRPLEDVGETIIVIGAFDEIGDSVKALPILTPRARELLNGLRVLLTSCFERDIQRALQTLGANQVDLMFMDHIPEKSTRLSARLEPPFNGSQMPSAS